MKNFNLCIFCILTVFLTACGGPSKPSKKEMQKAMFQEHYSYMTFHTFETNIVDNPELLKQNQCEVYVDTEFSYSEPFYQGYNLNNPYAFQDPKLMPLRKLAFENQKIKEAGGKPLSVVLWQVHEKNQRFKKKFVSLLMKTEKGWIEKEYTFKNGDKILGGLAMGYKNSLIWGSPEHLAELAEHGLSLPDASGKTDEEIRAERFNKDAKSVNYIPRNFKLL